MQRETFKILPKSPIIYLISILSLYAEGDVYQEIVRQNTGISILSLYAEGDVYQEIVRQNTGISILSLYAEGDSPQVLRLQFARTISILSLYAEGDMIIKLL